MSGEQDRKLNFLYLSNPDVVKVGLSLSECIALCTQCLSEHGHENVENPPKPGIHPLPDAFLHAMPSWLKESSVCGIKWVSGFPTNIPKRLPTIAGLIILNDVTTGMPIAVLDGTYITAIRTAATTGVAAKHLVRPDSEVLGIVGAGVQGKFHALVLNHVIPSLKRIKVFDQWQPSINSFLSEVMPALQDKGVEIDVVHSMEEAISNSDVVITATGKLLEPIFFEKWVKRGATVLPIHSAGWQKDIIAKMDRLVVDDWPQFYSMVESIYEPLPSGKEGPGSATELGEIVTGKKPGRQSASERIINFNVGMAMHDVLIASKIVEKAKEKGIGTSLEFMDLGAPLQLPSID